MTYKGKGRVSSLCYFGTISHSYGIISKNDAAKVLVFAYPWKPSGSYGYESSFLSSSYDRQRASSIQSWGSWGIPFTSRKEEGNQRPALLMLEHHGNYHDAI